MRAATGLSVAQALENDMKKKVLVIGAIATTAVVVGGWALAQSGSHGHAGFGPQFMQGKGPQGMGHGQMQQMMQQTGRGMGPGMMQHKGHGMGQGTTHRGPGFTFSDPAQIETLKSALGIAPAQEQAWTKYAKAVQEAATAMKTTREGIDPDTVSKLSPADRFAFVTKIREQAQKQFETVQTAADELLATLDDTQKTKAREILPGLASFGPGFMRGAQVSGPTDQHQGH